MLFSDALRKLRKDAGFPTAYRFFHDNGGQAALGFSYRQYMGMESGMLPDADKLSRLIQALRLFYLSPCSNRLITAWLRTRAGDEAYDRLIKPFLPAPTEEEVKTPLYGLVRAMMRERSYYLSHEQFAASMADYPTYLCYMALISDTGLWSSDGLAGALHIQKEDADRALKRLAAAKIAKRVRPGLYRCAFPHRMVQTPRLSAISAELYKKADENVTRLAATAETRLHEGVFVRADKDQFLGRFSPSLRFAVEASHGYSVQEKSPTTAIFYVEGRVVQVCDFRRGRVEEEPRGRTRFSDTLRKFRLEAGYPTAYKFYHGCGGRAALGISYRRYLLLEQGEPPEGGVLLKLRLLLSPAPPDARAGAFVAAWIRTVAGEETYNGLILPLLSAAAGGTHPPAAQAGPACGRPELRLLSLPQAEAVLYDYDAFVCFTALSADGGVWTPPGLSGALRLDAAAARKALQRLAKAGVLLKEGANGCKSAFAPAAADLPRTDMDSGLLRKLGTYTDRFAGSGCLRHRARNFFRAEAGEVMGSYLPLLRQSLETARNSGVRGGTEDSTLFYVECSLAKVRDF